MPDLTPAEAAADRLLPYSRIPDDDDARAVVAAVRPLIYGEVADRMLAHASEAEAHDATRDSVYAFMVAADRIRDWATEVDNA